jgi:hypothetical protein
VNWNFRGRFWAAGSNLLPLAYTCMMVHCIVFQSFIRRYCFAVLNVAAGKAPMQISSDLGGIPQKAIDGSTSSFFNVDTCTLTRAERTPWWYVNLLEPYMVQLVRLDFGKSHLSGQVAFKSCSD